MSTLRHRATVDAVDARLLLAMIDEPRATVMALSGRVGLSRNTVQARLAKLEDRDVLASLERRIDPASLGYPLSAFVNVRVTQRLLDQVADALAEVPEVIEVIGLSGATDLLVRLVARDGDDLYRLAGQILATEGVERTEIFLSMRQLVDHRVAPLLARIVDGD